MPERLYKRLLHDVVGLLPRSEQKRSPVRAQRVPGDQSAVSVKVAAPGAGYRLGVVDCSPYSAGHTLINTPFAAARFLLKRPGTSSLIFVSVESGCDYDRLILSDSVSNGEATMRFSILGPLEILDDAGRAVQVSRPLHRSALALLLINAGQRCSSASLAAGLWGDEPPKSPDVSLRSCVYGIRRLLPGPGRVRTHSSGYLITVAPGELDLQEFCDLAGLGRVALDEGDPKTAAAVLGRALSLWREPPLADVPAVPRRERLLDQRNDARDALADARLALGEHRAILAELRSAVAAEPLREHAWAQLIMALYRSGARTEALAAYGRLRVTLISAYGMDPGPELQELHKRVLADDPALMLTPTAAALIISGRPPRAGAALETAGAANTASRVTTTSAGNATSAVTSVGPGNTTSADNATSPVTSASPGNTTSAGNATSPVTSASPGNTRSAGNATSPGDTASAVSSASARNTPGPASPAEAASVADRVPDPADPSVVAEPVEMDLPRTWRPARQLPIAVTALIGRAVPLARLLGRLSGDGMTVAVVTGMLGTGKTALAVHAAHIACSRFPDGQLYACLDDGGRPRDPQAVLGELLRGLGLPAERLPVTRFEREALYRSLLAGRRVLALADGANAAAQVAPLLPGTAGSAVVVTSRGRIPDLDGASHIELGGLQPSDSVRLLAAYSGRDLGDGDHDGDQFAETEAVAARAIASACGHLPLALRLAGLRLADDPDLTVTDLAALLSDESRRLDELTVGTDSVRARLAAAADGVSRPAKRALARLAVTGSRRADARGSAIITLSDNAGCGKLAPELTAAGLLRRVSGDADQGVRRYLIHPLVPAYAGDLLADPDVAAAASVPVSDTGRGELVEQEA